MIDFKVQLENKWGGFSHPTHSDYEYNAPMHFISPNAKLNVLFSPKNEEDIHQLFLNHFDTDIPKDLMEFYKRYNGVRLFFGSLSVFGIQKFGEKDYQPYDLLMNNYNNRDCNRYDLVLVATIGGQYVFGFKRNELTKIYGFKVREGEIVQTFESFSDFFEHYFNCLFNEYDANAKKIHPNLNYKGIPCLEHLSYALM